MADDYITQINSSVDALFSSMVQRVSAQDMERIQAAYELADEAHREQRRKTGEPYIIHPIAVARIVAEELELGANPMIAAFLHDVVKDTPYTLDDISERFGDDVAFLVGVVTKQKKETYEQSKQVDNFRQMLASIQYDVRALMLKLADRLHNMRTLDSMRADKQMKIAGETDYFYAPLANRLGLYHVKTELENLSFRYRCPKEFAALEQMLEAEQDAVVSISTPLRTRFRRCCLQMASTHGSRCATAARTVFGARCSRRVAISVISITSTISASSIAATCRGRNRPVCASTLC